MYHHLSWVGGPGGGWGFDSIPANRITPMTNDFCIVTQSAGFPRHSCLLRREFKKGDWIVDVQLVPTKQSESARHRRHQQTTTPCQRHGSCNRSESLFSHGKTAQNLGILIVNRVETVDVYCRLGIGYRIYRRICRYRCCQWPSTGILPH